MNIYGELNSAKLTTYCCIERNRWVFDEVLLMNDTTKLQTTFIPRKLKKM